MARPRGKKTKYPFNVVGFEKALLWRWTELDTEMTYETHMEHISVRRLDWRRFYDAMKRYEKRNGVEFQYGAIEDGAWVRRIK